jgi:hypothetical protein
MGKIYPFQNHTSPPKTSGVAMYISISNDCHTVDNVNSARKTALVSIKMEKSPKPRETTYKKG